MPPDRWQFFKERSAASREKFEEAVPGSLRIVPQAELRREIERDYAAMQGMVLGDAPPFDWIMERLAAIEAEVNPD